MGIGGSRYGAGRPGWRQKCEHTLMLDIRKLARAGQLRLGGYGSWQWSCDGKPSGYISIRGAEDHVRLIYMWTPAGGDPQRFDYAVRVERTPCRYDGSRPWFHCPRCNSRRAVIYGIASDGRFGCRRCMCLGYAGEAEDTIDRLWRKLRKLEAKLGENYNRPKGMHRRTYHWIFAQMEEVEERKDEAFCLGALSLLRRFSGGKYREDSS